MLGKMQHKILQSETGKRHAAQANLDVAAAGSSCCLKLADLPSLKRLVSFVFWDVALHNNASMDCCYCHKPHNLLSWWR